MLYRTLNALRAFTILDNTPALVRSNSGVYDTIQEREVRCIFNFLLLLTVICSCD